MPHDSFSGRRLEKELRSGREQLLSGGYGERILMQLRRGLLSTTRNLYILRWVPEPEADLLWVLVDGTSVVHIECPRVLGASKEVFETVPVGEYTKRKMSRSSRRTLEAALELARSHIA